MSSLREALQELEERYRERCESCGGDVRACESLNASHAVFCPTLKARAALATQEGQPLPLEPTPTMRDAFLNEYLKDRPGVKNPSAYECFYSAYAAMLAAAGPAQEGQKPDRVEYRYYEERSWGPWKFCHNPEDIEAHIAQGYKYEIRRLYAAEQRNGDKQQMEKL